MSACNVIQFSALTCNDKPNSKGSSQNISTPPSQLDGTSRSAQEYPLGLLRNTRRPHPGTRRVFRCRCSLPSLLARTHTTSRMGRRRAWPERLETVAKIRFGRLALSPPQPEGPTCRYLLVYAVLWLICLASHLLLMMRRPRSDDDDPCGARKTTAGSSGGYANRCVLIE